MKIKVSKKLAKTSGHYFLIMVCEVNVAARPAALQGFNALRGHLAINTAKQPKTQALVEKLPVKPLTGIVTAVW